MPCQQPATAADNARLDAYLAGVENLPPMPTLMIRMIELFRQPDRDVDEIVRLMRQDPSLTAEVLRRCNRSFMGSEEPVMEVDEAVFRLGFYELYRITIALFGLKAMSAARAVKSLEVAVLWRHSALTAIVGGAIARDLGGAEGIIFTAGLLHDVGKIVLASAEGAPYLKLLNEHHQRGPLLSAAERAAFGFCHGEVGARLLQGWGVPEQVSEPVLCHHNLNWSSQYERPAAIVKLANFLAHHIEDIGSNEPCPLEPPVLHALAGLGLTPDELPALEQHARSDAKRLAAQFRF